MFFRSLFLAFGLLSLTACGTLEVGVEPVTQPAPLVATWTASATQEPAVPAVTATGTARPPERINFPVGGTNFTFTTRLDPVVPERYILQILTQQKMTITSSPNVTIEVFNAENKLVAATTSGPGTWEGIIPQTGDYVIVLHGDGFITVTIAIPPAGTG